MEKHDDTPSPSVTSTGRRAVLALGGAFASVGITSGAAASAAGLTEQGPDAELIAACRELGARIEAFNEHGDLGDLEDPFWVAYAKTKKAISDAKPQTFAGLLAKAEAAKVEAQLPDGGEDPSGGPAEDWAWDLVNDLLRLGGRA